MIQTKLLLGVTLAAALLLTACAGGKPAEETAPQPTIPETTAPAEETLPPLPDAILYYGEILEIDLDEEGAPVRLQMDSPRDGPFGMNLGDWTFYIDSGRRQTFDPGTLKVGDRVYVFHSPMVARSMPPQAAAFVVLNNIPMDASCGMYHKIETLTQEGEDLLITTDQGGKTLRAAPDTVILSPEGEEKTLSDLKEGNFLIAWYWDRGEEILSPSHLMLLPELKTE